MNLTGITNLSHHLLVAIPSSPSTMTVYIETARASLWLTLRAHTPGRRLAVPWISSYDDGMFRIRETRAIDREMPWSFFHLRSPRCTEASLPPRFRRLWYISKARERGYGIISSTLAVLALRLLASIPSSVAQLTPTRRRYISKARERSYQS
ncbi:hypothetical protein SCHPADRAFT_743610 [Schizopora paradoxa]|uniref:Uncharacterized protein n=1 Tax=Schizopora paradoxa TaxID=27342 RepID=A0A0H2R5W4_9AGAM|nr:hypothetical protein SCHPADRAFT_743610 [Schizopora paradoxa]